MDNSMYWPAPLDIDGNPSMSIWLGPPMAFDEAEKVARHYVTIYGNAAVIKITEVSRYGSNSNIVRSGRLGG